MFHSTVKTPCKSPFRQNHGWDRVKVWIRKWEKSHKKCISMPFFKNCFLKEIWILKSGNSWKSPTHAKLLWAKWFLCLHNTLSQCKSVHTSVNIWHTTLGPDSLNQPPNHLCAYSLTQVQWNLAVCVRILVGTSVAKMKKKKKIIK